MGIGSFRGERGLDTFTIERKPPNKVLAMMQPVYDTNHDPVELRRGGWPLRWENYALSTGPDGLADSSPDAWRFEEDDTAQNVIQTYSTDGSAEGVAWLRYRHIVPEMDDWMEIDDADVPTTSAEGADSQKRRTLNDDADKDSSMEEVGAMPNPQDDKAGVTSNASEEERRLP